MGKTINIKLKKVLTDIVNDEVIKEARPEAIKVLSKATEKELGEFLYHYHSESVVTLCVIDSIKDRLIEEGKLKQKDGDHFGLKYTKEFLNNE